MFKKNSKGNPFGDWREHEKPDRSLANMTPEPKEHLGKIRKRPVKGWRLGDIIFRMMGGRP